MWTRVLSMIAPLALWGACGSDDDGAETGDRAPAEEAGAAERADAGATGESRAEADPPDASPGAEYPATEEGLAELVRDLRELAAEEDRARAYPLAESLRLGEPEAFFGGHFGAELGAELADEYEETAERIAELVPLLRELADAGKREVSAEAFGEPSERATGYQSAALERMTDPTPLYSVRLREEGAERGFHIWSFAHDGERFRWVGKMRAVAPEEQVPELPEEFPEELPEELPRELAEDLREGAAGPQDVELPDLLELPERDRPDDGD